jgi:hypothetical protein
MGSNSGNDIDVGACLFIPTDQIPCLKISVSMKFGSITGYIKNKIR